LLEARLAEMHQHPEKSIAVASGHPFQPQIYVSIGSTDSVKEQWRRDADGGTRRYRVTVLTS
jgi:hypothetical protein